MWECKFKLGKKMREKIENILFLEVHRTGVGIRPQFDALDMGTN